MLISIATMGVGKLLKGGKKVASKLAVKAFGCQSLKNVAKNVGKRELRKIFIKQAAIKMGKKVVEAGA